MPPTSFFEDPAGGIKHYKKHVEDMLTLGRLWKAFWMRKDGPKTAKTTLKWVPKLFHNILCFWTCDTLTLNNDPIVWHIFVCSMGSRKSMDSVENQVSEQAHKQNLQNHVANKSPKPHPQGSPEGFRKGVKSIKQIVEPGVLRDPWEGPGPIFQCFGYHF